MSASLRSRRVGSVVGPTCCSVTRTRTRPPSSDLLKAWRPKASRRMPHSGSSAISTSAIKLLVVGCFTDQTASSVAPDEIVRPQRLAVGKLDVDAGVVLRETGDLNAVVDRHPQLVDPARQDALDLVLPQPEPVVVPRGKVADVQGGPRGSPVGLRMQPRNEKFFTLFSKAGSNVVESAAILIGFAARAARRRAELDKRMLDMRARRWARIAREE